MLAPVWGLALIVALLNSFDLLRAQPNRTIRALENEIKSQNASHHITIDGDNFMIDGERLHIVSGSLHYFRVPAYYWRDRLRKLKAAGLNSVSTYIEWSFHEPEERLYRFENDYDIASFVRIAAEEGLHVLLRPGPYICAERDLGGFPYWLLSKYPNIKLRTTDKDFANESEIWMNKLFEQLGPLLFGNGGPIILVQVENEYGSYGSDMSYRIQQRNIIAKHVGTNAILYTTDGLGYSYFSNGAIPGTLTTIDFGPSSRAVQELFHPLRQYMPSGPLMNSEYYPGWLTHWGEPMANVSTTSVVKTLEDMLKNNINVNIYVFFGGSNFEFTAGANYDGTYQPDITSYDYDAPLSEAGDPTPKYNAIRELLHKHKFGDPNIELPQPSSKGNYGIVKVYPKLNLLSPEGRAALGKTYKDVNGLPLPTFESLWQRGGFVLYETTLTQTDGLLHIEKPRDLIFVFVDGKLQGKISRMHKMYSLPLISKNGSILALLVENQGRINFGSYIHDFKGILSDVSYAGKILNDTWKITGYPLEIVNIDVDSAEKLADVQVPTLFEAQFTLPETSATVPLDTFLDTTGWDKGFIWINGHNLGRYWPPLGPQTTLYVPGIWLNSAPQKNLIQVLELNKPSKELTVNFIDHPILNKTGSFSWIQQ